MSDQGLCILGGEEPATLQAPLCQGLQLWYAADPHILVLGLKRSCQEVTQRGNTPSGSGEVAWTTPRAWV